MDDVGAEKLLRRDAQPGIGGRQGRIAERLVEEYILGGGCDEIIVSAPALEDICSAQLRRMVGCPWCIDILEKCVDAGRLDRRLLAFPVDVCCEVKRGLRPGEHDVSIAAVRGRLGGRSMILAAQIVGPVAADECIDERTAEEVVVTDRSGNDRGGPFDLDARPNAIAHQIVVGGCPTNHLEVRRRPQRGRDIDREFHEVRRAGCGSGDRLGCPDRKRAFGQRL